MVLPSVFYKNVFSFISAGCKLPLYFLTFGRGGKMMIETKKQNDPMSETGIVGNPTPAQLERFFGVEEKRTTIKAVVPSQRTEAMEDVPTTGALCGFWDEPTEILGGGGRKKAGRGLSPEVS
jgi:hypothetical protein